MSSISESLAALALGVWFPAALLFAQPQAAPAPLEANQSLTGTVVNSVTGEPVRRALVSFAQWFTLTDGDGRFEFHDLPYLQTSISVRKPGFFNEQDVAGGQLPENMVVTSGLDPAPIVAKLIPEGVVFGRVESEAGPIEGTQVKLLAARVRDGERHWEQQGFAMTGDDGSFRIANLMPGSYYLVLAANTSPELSDRGIRRSYLATPSRTIRACRILPLPPRWWSRPASSCRPTFRPNWRPSSRSQAR